jgi:type I restriction enzyme, R subunit
LTAVKFDEGAVERALIAFLKELGWKHVHGLQIAPDGPHPERGSYADTVLVGRLREAIKRLNPSLPSDAHDAAFRGAVRPPGTTVLARNRAFHSMLTDGVAVEFKAKDGKTHGDRVRLFDIENPSANDWLAVNQFTVEVTGPNGGTRRPDVVLFVNGLPLGLTELKNPADADATMQDAFNQLRTYQDQVPDIFSQNEMLVITDGIEASMGTITSDFGRFMAWKTIDGRREQSGADQMETLARGALAPERFLDLVSGFIAFEDGVSETQKKLAAYHQYWAVKRAVDSTVEASAKGDRRAGVVWHTQGSGKSLSMIFYAARLIRDGRFRNPTIVVITDRNDLDGQLFGNFASVPDLIPAPEQAESRQDLRERLTRASGGVVFTTIQKFSVEEGEDDYPLLSNRDNVVVIADEAHRSQYELLHKGGFARNVRRALPNASFIGFTGTPIETGDRITRAVFGDYIDIYDIEQSVRDHATVPISYEARIAEIDLDPQYRPHIDPDFEDVVEDEEEKVRHRMESRWSRIEAVVGTDERLRAIAADIVQHFEKRLDAMEGKAMVVSMSRRIAARLYAEIVEIRPDWHDDDDKKGALKVVITGAASDPAELQPHVRGKSRNQVIQARLKDPADPLRMVIVRDMWLTGFDCPPLHTLYVDKPMKGHTLMQAIARVNRVYKSKPGGLVVDYIGLGEWLKQAVRDYTDSHGRGDPVVDIAVAVAAFNEKLGVCRDMFHGCDYSGFIGGSEKAQLHALVKGLEFVEANRLRERVLAATGDLLQSFRLAGTEPEVLGRRDEVAFFLAVRGRLLKITQRQKVSADELSFRIGQIVSRAVVSGGVKDIFAEAGIRHPNLSLVDEQFLAEVRELPEKNLAAAALERLLRDEIKIRLRRSIVDSVRFSERLDATMRKYHNRRIEAAQVVLELIEMAKDLDVRVRRGEAMGLNEDELAFYDALSHNQSAVDLMGDEVLGKLARELTSTLRRSVTVDWSLRESVRARLRIEVKKLLRKFKYPPDMQEGATDLVLKQAEALGDDWTASGPAQPLLRLVSEAEAEPYVKHLPVMSLAAAAGHFLENRPIVVEGWLAAPGRLRPGMFVARVEGRSMEPRIPAGSYCVFRAEPGGGPLAGSRQGKIILAALIDAADPEDGGAYTVKVYRRLEPLSADSEREARIQLESLNPAFAPIQLAPGQDVTVAAEFIGLADRS